MPINQGTNNKKEGNAIILWKKTERTNEKYNKLILLLNKCWHQEIYPHPSYFVSSFYHIRPIFVWTKKQQKNLSFDRCLWTALYEINCVLWLRNYVVSTNFFSSPHTPSLPSKEVHKILTRRRMYWLFLLFSAFLSEKIFFN